MSDDALDNAEASCRRCGHLSGYHQTYADDPIGHCRKMWCECHVFVAEGEPITPKPRDAASDSLAVAAHIIGMAREGDVQVTLNNGRESRRYLVKRAERGESEKPGEPPIVEPK